MSKPCSEHVAVLNVDGIGVDVYGCWDEETPKGEYDFYDLFHGDTCINLGEPIYGKPTVEIARKYLENHIEVERMAP